MENEEVGLPVPEEQQAFILGLRLRVQNGELVPAEELKRAVNMLRQARVSTAAPKARVVKSKSVALSTLEDLI